MASLCEGGNDPPDFLKSISKQPLSADTDQPAAGFTSACRSRGGRSSNQNGGTSRNHPTCSDRIDPGTWIPSLICPDGTSHHVRHLQRRGLMEKSQGVNEESAF
ncbi:hypothetical protein ANN_26414 [Periplaneta americana]|uniref:Uncharacterized protein n=1 Tax=Periplaneta americana TaxID=6978 RepID=A0ABQ8RY59_PERAM|nr:hypothetical protein ANN_26414 [Periplaneta americana]